MARRVIYFTASMRSSGTSARRIISAESSTRGSRLRRQSRSFSSVLQLHVRALAAIAVLVGHEVELLVAARACRSE